MSQKAGRNFSLNEVGRTSLLDEADENLSSTTISCGVISFLSKLFKHRFGSMLNHWLASSLRSGDSKRLLGALFPPSFASVQRTRFGLNISNSKQNFNENSFPFPPFSNILDFLGGNLNNSSYYDLDNTLGVIPNGTLPAFLTFLSDQSSSPYIKLHQLCDVAVDCPGSFDEMYCPGRFYCTNGKPLYVESSQVMDGVADCSDVSDEWVESPIRHRLSSKNSLIESWVLQVLVWVIGISALSGNLIVIVSTIASLVNANCTCVTSAFKKRRLQSHNGKRISGMNRSFHHKPRPSKRSRLVRTWNSVLVLNLATADMLMGVYLTWLAAISSSFEKQSSKQLAESQYWNFDRKWRTSASCNALGVMLVVSSQTSVFTLIALTSLRLFTVLKPFACYRLKFKFLALTCCSTWIISIILAAVPVIPTLKNSFVKEAFVSLPQIHPPDVNKTTAEILVKKVALVGNSTNVFSTATLSWRKMYQYMQENAQNVPNWRLYGYYSEDSVCMPKLFVNPKEDTFWGYTLTLIIINCASVVYIAIAYTTICLRSSRKRKKVQLSTKITFVDATNKEKTNSNNNDASNISKAENLCEKSSSSSKNMLYQRSTSTNSKKEESVRQRHTNSANEIQQRVALLVATDCACWIPICVMSFVSVAGYSIPQTAYAITAVGLLPINSALNPILYSRFIRSLWLKCWSTLPMKRSA